MLDNRFAITKHIRRGVVTYQAHYFPKGERASFPTKAEATAWVKARGA